MIAELTDWRNVDAKLNYAVEGHTLIGLLKICAAVNQIKGSRGIDVKTAEGAIDIGLAGLTDPNTNGGSTITFGVQRIELCLSNVNYVMYVMGSTPVPA